MSSRHHRHHHSGNRDNCHATVTIFPMRVVVVVDRHVEILIYCIHTKFKSLGCVLRLSISWKKAIISGCVIVKKKPKAIKRLSDFELSFWLSFSLTLILNKYELHRQSRFTHILCAILLCHPLSLSSHRLSAFSFLSTA